MHKEQLDKFNRLFKAEDECAQAYATHCTEAIKATEANALKEGFDEYTDMVSVKSTSLKYCISKVNSCCLASQHVG